MNLFQIGLLISLPVHTYLLTCEIGYWSIFIYVYMTESNNRVFEVAPTADAIEHEFVSIVSCTNQDYFHCPEEGCIWIFQTFNGL
jgi:hypothetical protein